MRYEDEKDQELIHDPGERVADSDEYRPELQLTKQEKRWVALGALKAALMLGAVYLVGLGVIIWLLLKFWL